MWLFIGFIVSLALALLSVALAASAGSKGGEQAMSASLVGMAGVLVFGLAAFVILMVAVFT